MPRLPDTPVTVTSSSEDVTKSHPSFGVARFSRISGLATLFGSEIKHNSFIRFTVCPAVSEWSLHETRIHSHFSPRYVEVDMSAAQFAELITGMGNGTGTPCTIRTIDNKEIPGFIEQDNLHEQIKDDIKAKGADVTREIDELVALTAKALADSTLSKAKQAAILGSMTRLKMQLDVNLPFILDLYQEAAESVRAKCAAEADAMVTHTIQRLGIERLSELKAESMREALQNNETTAH